LPAAAPIPTMAATAVTVAMIRVRVTTHLQSAQAGAYGGRLAIDKVACSASAVAG